MNDFAAPLPERKPHGGEPWQPCTAPATDPRRRVAVHEAGHVVVLRAFAITAPMAVASPSGGHTDLPVQAIAHAPALAAPCWQAAVCAAAVCHAGALAELIDTDRLPAWVGPLENWSADDMRRACDILRDGGGFAPQDDRAAHGAAQRLAAHILLARWPEVQAVAAELERCGRWTPDLTH